MSDPAMDGAAAVHQALLTSDHYRAIVTAAPDHFRCGLVGGGH
ncbi:hypothetical protein [Flindersiella endophytica]